MQSHCIISSPPLPLSEWVDRFMVGWKKMGFQCWSLDWKGWMDLWCLFGEPQPSDECAIITRLLVSQRRSWSMNLLKVERFVVLYNKRFSRRDNVLQCTWNGICINVEQTQKKRGHLYPYLFALRGYKVESVVCGNKSN